MVFATLTAAVMIGQQVASKATRDALFLSMFKAEWLPRVMVVSAAISVVGVLLMGRALARWGPARAAPVAFIVSAALFVAEYVLSSRMPMVVAFATYAHVAGLGSILISGFWSVVNERFDPYRARSSIARIGIGATFGGAVGGAVAERVAVWSSVSSMLLVLAVLNVVCALGVRRLGVEAADGTTARASRGSKGTGANRSSVGGFELLSRTAYLRRLAVLVAVVALSTTYLDFALKATAAAELGDGPALMQFFAVFYTAAAIGGFVLQTGLTRPALAKLGLAGTMAVLPLSTILFGTVGAVIGRMWAVIAARGAEMVLSNSLFRSGYELLYTPLPPEQKRSPKAIIDVGFERFGDALASGSILVLLLFGEAVAVRSSLGLAVVSSLGALWLARRLHTGYVDALAESLRSGVVKLEEDAAVDATTKRTLVDTTMALDREKLLAQISALRAASPSSTESPPRETPRSALLKTIERLFSQDVAGIREVLNDTLEPAAAVHVLPLLDRAELRGDAVRSLRTIAPRITGLLVDALLDPTGSVRVRSRLPRVLAVCAPGRASEGLLCALDDPGLEVRLQAACALSAIKDRHPDYPVPVDRVFSAVRSELDSDEWDATTEAEEVLPVEWITTTIQHRFHRRLEHVFTLLGLVLDRRALGAALRALSSDDARLRGTALEYLENVLPEDIRRALSSHLDELPRASTPGSGRPGSVEIADDLLQSLEAFDLDRELLSKDTK